MTLRLVKIYPAFERFWHWSQTVLIFLLLLTGFEIHGFYQLLGFANSVVWHTSLAIAMMILWILSVFWHLTTGTWRHYIPTTVGLWQVIRFYTYGVFHGEHHPYNKVYWRKHNPLQALAYLKLKLILLLSWVTGIAYMVYFTWYNSPGASDTLATVALVHTAAAFATIAFIIIHVYMLTTGHSFIEHLSPMITGFDKVKLSPHQILRCQ